ncbi:MAG: hypothetical protein M1837_006592 [Sclerophora amabilis]|nr:MAG: hypothetical protein M1837_006592 [Sclerophora amabilis]
MDLGVCIRAFLTGSFWRSDAQKDRLPAETDQTQLDTPSPPTSSDVSHLPPGTTHSPTHPAPALALAHRTRTPPPPANLKRALEGDSFEQKAEDRSSSRAKPQSGKPCNAGDGSTESDVLEIGCGSRVMSRYGRNLEEFYRNIERFPRNRRMPISCLRPEKRRKLSFAQMLKMLHDNTDQDTAPFPLMKLPPELRSRIFDFALLREMVHPYTYRHSHKGEAPYVNLLRANRQVHDEAEGILYMGNCFSFKAPADLELFTLFRSELQSSSLVRSLQLVPTVDEDFDFGIREEDERWPEAHREYYDALREAWVGIETAWGDMTDLLDHFKCLQCVRVDVSRSGCHSCEELDHELARDVFIMAMYSQTRQVELTALANLKDPTSAALFCFDADWATDEEFKRGYFGFLRLTRRFRKKQKKFRRRELET